MCKKGIPALLRRKNGSPLRSVTPGSPERKVETRHNFCTTGFRAAVALVLLSVLATVVPKCDGFAILEGKRQSSAFSRLYATISPITAPPYSSEVQEGLAYVRTLIDAAVRERGTERGLEALDLLGRECSNRVAFDFGEPRPKETGRNIVSPVPGLLPRSTTSAIFGKVEQMIQKGWLSTNPDSVDGLPSFHLNLISGGKPIVVSSSSSSSPENPNGNNNKVEHDDGLFDGFDDAVLELIDLIEPYVEHKLLPQVRKLMDSPTIEIDEIFLRRYGQDVMGDGKSRNGISAHYDVFSRVTSVIALDDTAREGTNGLFTTCPTTSNHAALRRFFPLGCGDAVVHTWDVLHGVDCQPGVDRTSLIVWFTDNNNDDDKEEEESNSRRTTTTPPPWLTTIRSDLEEANGVSEFVLATALESSGEKNNPKGTKEEEQPKASSSSASSSKPRIEDHSSVESMLNPLELYLRSASTGNAFALTRLGSFIEEQEEELADSDIQRLVALLDQLDNGLHSLVVVNDDNNSNNNNNDSLPGRNTVVMNLSRKFWLEGALRGSPQAQLSLANELMLESTTTTDSVEEEQPPSNDDKRLLAAVLLGLATQQGDENALECLQRVIQWEVSQGFIRSQEDFATSPIVAVARVASQYIA